MATLDSPQVMRELLKHNQILCSNRKVSTCGEEWKYKRNSEGEAAVMRQSLSPLRAGVLGPTCLIVFRCLGP